MSKNRYKVEILYKTIKTVYVYAEDEAQAEEIAENACNMGVEDDYWESQPYVTVSKE